MDWTQTVCAQDCNLYKIVVKYPLTKDFSPSKKYFTQVTDFSDWIMELWQCHTHRRWKGVRALKRAETLLNCDAKTIAHDSQRVIGQLTNFVVMNFRIMSSCCLSSSVKQIDKCMIIIPSSRTEMTSTEMNSDTNWVLLRRRLDLILLCKVPQSQFFSSEQHWSLDCPMISSHFHQTEISNWNSDDEDRNLKIDC